MNAQGIPDVQAADKSQKRSEEQREEGGGGAGFSEGEVAEKRCEAQENLSQGVQPQIVNVSPRLKEEHVCGAFG